MLRLSSILQLQTVWEGLPNQPSSPMNSSDNSIKDAAPSLVSPSEAAHPETADQEQDLLATSDSIKPVETAPSSSIAAMQPSEEHDETITSLPASPPASMHSGASTSISDQSPTPIPDNLNAASALMASDFDANHSAIHINVNDDIEEGYHTSSSMFEAKTDTTKNDLTVTSTKKSQSSPTSAMTTPPLSPLPPVPPFKYPPPPPVPSKDEKRYILSRHQGKSKINKISNIQSSSNDDSAEDASASITRKSNSKSGRYSFLGTRSSAGSTKTNSPPASLHSFATPPNPTSVLISGANKALRRESSKLNMRRKSFSKKLKKAISNIKLNANGEPAAINTTSNITTNTSAINASAITN